MALLLDAAYLLVLLLLSPWLIYKASTTGKYRRGLAAKFFGPRLQPDASRRPNVWFHGVSVGEIHLLRPVIAAFRRACPEFACVVSTTTDTGFDEAKKAFPDLPIFYFPLDLSWAIRRALRQIDPALLVMAEGELWPNLFLAARKRGTPVAIINARMSPRSLRRYRLVAPIARFLVRLPTLIATQTVEYAAAFHTLGVEWTRIHVTGNVKFDGVTGDRKNVRTSSLRRLLGVGSSDLIWVVGSTQAPEEEIALGIYRRLRAQFPRLRLFLVPRQKDRFDEVARLCERSGLPFARRSTLTSDDESRGLASEIVLVDTIGELGALWGLADVAYVGGSLDGKRGGQNMIEPAAYGSAVLFGPHVWNFRDTVDRLLRAGAARQIDDAPGLERAVNELLADRTERERIGQLARTFVTREQGATERTVMHLKGLLSSPGQPRQVA
jgi:3-deoxy-D-manno-octulosonic-acid transferase